MSAAHLTPQPPLAPSAASLPRETVVVTGLGVVLPNCDDRTVLWAQLSEGQSQLTLEEDPLTPGKKLPMGRVHGFDPDKALAHVPLKQRRLIQREQGMYLASLHRAQEDAGLSLCSIAPDRVGVYDGTSRGNFAFWYERILAEKSEGLSAYGRRELVVGASGQAASLAAALMGVRGPTYTFNNTCSSGAVAIGHAMQALESGRLDVAFATGHDTPLIAPVFQMYRSAELLAENVTDARRALRPYGGDSKNAFGEGAVTLLLETASHARKRGARPLAVLAGYEYGNNGLHPTHVDVTGARPTQLIRKVLQDCELPSTGVGFVVGHGNGSPQSDRSELAYMRQVFGGRASEVPLISVKPVYGHSMGAASALNVAASVLMLHHQFLVPTVNLDPAKVAPGFNHQLDGARARCEAGLAVSYGIGGNNTVILVRKA